MAFQFLKDPLFAKIMWSQMIKQTQFHVYKIVFDGLLLLFILNLWYLLTLLKSISLLLSYNYFRFVLHLSSYQFDNKFLHSIIIVSHFLFRFLSFLHEALSRGALLILAATCWLLSLYFFPRPQLEKSSICLSFLRKAFRSGLLLLQIIKL